MLLAFVGCSNSVKSTASTAALPWSVSLGVFVRLVLPLGCYELRCPDCGVVHVAAGLHSRVSCCAGDPQSHHGRPYCLTMLMSHAAGGVSAAIKLLAW